MMSTADADLGIDIISGVHVDVDIDVHVDADVDADFNINVDVDAHVDIDVNVIDVDMDIDNGMNLSSLMSTLNSAVRIQQWQRQQRIAQACRPSLMRCLFLC